MSTIKSPLPEEALEVAALALHDTLVDLVDLALVGKQAHWNVTGPRFRTIHFQLDEVVATARTHADTIAERTATIGVPADARVATVAKETRISQVDAGWLRDDDVVAMFVRIYGEAIERLRRRAADTERADPVTNNILVDIIQDLEKQYWMWQAETG
ncbi:starvation-inducible DNA-binding protein [Haloactinopolyspora alba]|uniref:Starvation-inducible DNA-binding protein n=1 Tax=Haloactinopolyspora alba TaxID=648780 RepID=A0A2P8DGR7_9ACTN|nr:DNA starvation/stationary phase protection protein [Haloactinopolyspora alba]PSK96379.1 starvation-inducible DNA-binding protein [Haloactinopolyspora alba]